LANRAARRTPALGEFLQARLIYPYEPGAVYELHTAPGYVSMILLEPGESLVDIAAGDTARWMVSSTLSGAGETSRTLVLVKPQAGGLRTNLVLVTDRRAYVVEAISAPGEAYAAQMAWRYPAAAPAPAGVEPASAPRVVNAGYRIRPPRGGAPAWMPERVFDDGARTFIAFPASIAASDMPPLFIRTGEGLELVNYRVAGRVYEVDRLFERAELRLVRAAPVVVRIERIGAGRGGRGGS
jgi:type IV secretion system protein VirB9